MALSSRMNRSDRRARSGRIVAVVLLSVSAVACGTTTIDETVGDGNVSVDDVIGDTDQPGLAGDGRELADDDITPLDSGVIVDGEASATTVPIMGSAAEILPEIGVDMSRLSADISEDTDEDATLARIQANWDAIRDEIERDRPELLNGIQTTVDMATTAVERNRPADADKAFGLLNDLVDAFTGDS